MVKKITRSEERGYPESPKGPEKGKFKGRNYHMIEVKETVQKLPLSSPHFGKTKKHATKIWTKKELPKESGSVNEIAIPYIKENGPKFAA